MTAYLPRVGDTITTAAQVRDLPTGVVVRTHNGILCETDGVGLVTPRWYAQGRVLEAQHLPATVLYVPGEQPRPFVTDGARTGTTTATTEDAVEDAYRLDGGRPVSVIAQKVATEHLMTSTSGCICGEMRLGESYPRHVATTTERAVRERIAAEIEARADHEEDAFASSGLKGEFAEKWQGMRAAAEIARGGGNR